NARAREPIIYIGFPLLQTTLQRQTFVATFLGGIQRLLDLHAQRRLLVLSRATVTNSLVLAKCWYILSVVLLPLSTLIAIKSIISKFVSQEIFSKIRWQILTAPKTVDGLEIMDPSHQQNALFYKAIDALL
ncbi:hypothetical protein EDC96DRAFT_413982, partial [Choanephora cucurbitarum]